MIVFFGVLSYILGCILFGPVIAKLYNLGDLRKKGSGNVGATNAMRISGKKHIGIFIALLDALKGFIPVVLAKYFCIVGLNLMIIGCLVVVGHIFPIWSRFKGGKGVATLVGINLALEPKIAMIMVLCWLTTFLLKKISSFSSIVMVTTCIIAYLFYFDFIKSLPMVLICLLVLLKHKKNIIGLINGSEKCLKI